ncbi:MAG: homocysteine methyltransferase [Ruminococcaceae bacterium]|nr:homocysteine methyltransferase [Oscillospiraceae bacterium]
MDFNRRLIFDGAMGTELQKMGLAPGELPETWNILYPERVASVHRAYFAAGADIVCTNTFGANLLKFNKDELKSIIEAAVSIARAEAPRGKFVALDIGPLGKMLAPFGDLEFEKAVQIFAETVKLGAAAGVDMIALETFADTYEIKAAMLAVRENCDLPVLASCAYDADGHVMTGGDAAAMVALLEGLGADMIGANCGVGPDLILPTAKTLVEYASVPVTIKANAGLPKIIDGKTVFTVSPEDFARDAKSLAELGVSALGGCCGTTPDHIRATVAAIKDIHYTPVKNKNITLVSSYSHAVTLGNTPKLIGERINPTGKKLLKEALRTGDISYILSQGSNQAEAGAHILDVNVGLPEIDEANMMCHVINELQSVIDLPLQIDTSDPETMARAARIYNGKPLLNSVNGKKESMEAVFPIAKKYGGVVVGLTLDENGIPDIAEGRAAIAERIINTAAEYGIDKKNIIIDPLTLTVATDKNAASVTLSAVKIIKEKLDVKTCLGVSNVSFGLPAREKINSVFFSLALAAKLDAAIMNPSSEAMMNSYRSYLALSGEDEACADYIEFASMAVENSAPISEITLFDAIVKGLSSKAAELTAEELKTRNAMSIINEILVPALDKVGKGFASGLVFLPQLLISAEAAKAAFSVIKSSMTSEHVAKKGKIILATVRGDIHDIGKNIVASLLENYNYEVIDLGRDVAPEAVVAAAKEHGVRLVGLSALMTTTVPAMQETINAIRSELPDCKVMVGGAVLTQDYADMIGADHYSPDAMNGVRFAEEILG